LCLELGFAHPDDLLKNLTSSQISEWEAYNKIEPFGEWRDDGRVAMLCSVISNLAIRVHAKKGTKMTSAADFMPQWYEEKGVKKQSVEEMKEVLLAIAKKQNRLVKKLKNTPPRKLRK